MQEATPLRPEFAGLHTHFTRIYKLADIAETIAKSLEDSTCLVGTERQLAIA
jgi:hypothetical protein